MARFTLILLVALITILLVPPAFAQASAKDLLRESSLHFDKGHYQKALDVIGDLNIKSLDNSDDMKLALKIRAICFDQTNKSKEASETLKELFSIDPDYDFNLFDTPKSLVELARKEKSIINEKNRQLATLRSEAHQEQRLEPKQQDVNLKERLIFIEKKPHLVSTLFPLGLNHFYLNSPVRGGIYLSVQTLGLITNIAAYFLKQSYLESFGSSRLKEQGDHASFQTVQTIQYIGLGTLVVGYGISVIDALIRFKSMPTQKVSNGEITL